MEQTDPRRTGDRPTRFFVRGVDVDPHESLDDLLAGVAALDPDESLDPLVDEIAEMASERQAQARQLRQEGIDEAA